ncbi:hypothetical protein VCV18_000612 [Metarhizium anisopliae]
MAKLTTSNAGTAVVKSRTTTSSDGNGFWELSTSSLFFKTAGGDDQRHGVEGKIGCQWAPISTHFHFI